MNNDYRSLYDILSDHPDRICDKWEHYPNIYEAEIGPRVKMGNPLRLLEIGVQNGGSLEVWHKYLPPGSKIVGVDINERCGQLGLPDNVQFLLGSATDPDLVARIPEPEFDIIVDDGSHRSSDVIAAFALLFDRLAPGGVI
ncbi:class I SAM-dependent methyltransferase [Methylobacterium oryzae CBMB20]